MDKNDNKWFQHALKIPLNYEEIKKDPWQISKIRPFMNKHNWKGINYPSGEDDWKRFDKK